MCLLHIGLLSYCSPARATHYSRKKGIRKAKSLFQSLSKMQLRKRYQFKIWKDKMAVERVFSSLQTVCFASSQYKSGLLVLD